MRTLLFRTFILAGIAAAIALNVAAYRANPATSAYANDPPCTPQGAALTANSGTKPPVCTPIPPATKPPATATKPPSTATKPPSTATPANTPVPPTATPSTQTQGCELGPNGFLQWVTRNWKGDVIGVIAAPQAQQQGLCPGVLIPSSPPPPPPNPGTWHIVSDCSGVRQYNDVTGFVRPILSTSPAVPGCVPTQITVERPPPAPTVANCCTSVNPLGYFAPVQAPQFTGPVRPPYSGDAGLLSLDRAGSKAVARW